MVPSEAKCHIIRYYYLFIVTLEDKPLVSFNQGAAGSRPVRPTKASRNERLVAGAGFEPATFGL